MASIAFPSLAKFVTLQDGTHYGYIKVDAKPGKPSFLFLHGYPSSSYDWRHQAVQFPAHGYGIILPDLLGYGDTDKPKDIESYELSRMAGHVIELLDEEEIKQVVGIGHDWGCGLLSCLAQRHQQRFSLLIFLAVGYIANSAAFADVDQINKVAVENIGRPIFGYWNFHNDPAAAEILDNTNPRVFSSLTYPADPKTWIDHVCYEGALKAWMENGTITELPTWLSGEEDETHSNILKAGGFTGPLNWYKQAMAGISAKKEANLTDEDRKLKVPTLFVGCEKDYICVPFFQEQAMRPWTEDLTVASVDAGHWLMMEKKDDLFEIILDFTRKRLSGFSV